MSLYRSFPVSIHLLLLLVCGAASAQVPITVAGRVVDRTGQPVAQATVEIVGGQHTTSAVDGSFALLAFSGTPRLRVLCPGYETAERALDVTTRLDALELTLEPAARLSDAIVVSAVRAGAETSVTKTDLAHEEIARLNYGQEMPFVLQSTPSATNYSETGI